MFNHWQLARKYLRYYITASNGKGHGVHSPFVYDLVRNVLMDTRSFYAYKQVEGLREQLLQDKTLIEVEDFGAGSVTGSSRQRSVASIARHAAKSRKWGQLLFRIVHYYAPLNILELGTSLGISTSYMALGCRDARIVTGEGSAAIAEMARRNFKALKLDNIQLTTGNFDNTLGGMLNQLPTIDLAFLDGNHRLEPTLRYFDQLLPKIHSASVVIIDDIHWSPDMEQAWQVIRNHASVKCSIDLFFIGIIFFREEFHEKQHFTIRF